MASRVNTKFVVILVGALVVIAGGVGFAANYAISNRGADLVAKGDAFIKEGKMKEAGEMYSRAVNKDPSRVDWLMKWFGVLKEEVPATQTQMQEKYQFYVTILRNLAKQQPGDAAAQEAYLSELNERGRSARGSRQAMQSQMEEVTERLEGLKPEDAATKKLRRYRGIAAVHMLRFGNVEQKFRDEALADLNAALEADPTDTESAMSKLAWHLSMAERLELDGQKAEAAEQKTLARTVVQQLLDRDANNIEARMALAGIGFGEKLDKAASPEQRQALVKEARAETLQILAAAKSADPATLRSETIEGLVNRVRASGEKEDYEAGAALMSAVLAARPDDFQLRLAYGMFLKDLQKEEEAIGELQKIIDAPGLKVGLKGMQLPAAKVYAYMGQSEAALSLAQRADGEARKAAAARARQYRDKLNEQASANQKDLVDRMDARLAFFDGKYDVSVSKLTQLRSSGRFQSDRDKAEVLGLLGMSLEGLKNLGEARRVYEERLAIEGYRSDSWTLLRLGEVFVQLDDVKSAALYYERALALDPQNEALKNRLRAIQTARAQQGGQAVTDQDPLVAKILEARGLRESNDLAGARAILESLATQFPGEYRVIRERAELEIGAGDRATAVRVVEDALKVLPNDQRLKQLKVQAEIEDPVKAMEVMIADAEITPMQKALARSNLYFNNLRYDDAAKALAEAEQISPEDPAVLEMGFVQAIATQNIEKARQIVPRAAKANADQLNGLLYQGRMALVDGKGREAVELFSQVVQKNPHLPLAWRFLGQANQMAGRVNESLDAYKRALEGRPNDVETIRQYTNALARAGRCVEALERLDPEKGGGLRYAPNDEPLVKLWLELEGRCGDKLKAIERREALFNMNPKDSDNVLVLSELYTERSEWDKLTRLIDAFEKAETHDPLLAAYMRATMSARRGNVGEGVEIFKAHLNKTPRDKQRTADYLTFGQFLVNNRMLTEAFVAVAAGRDLQDPKVREIDRRLGDYAFEAGGQAMQRWENLGPQVESPDIDAETKAKLTAEREKALAEGKDYLAKAADSYKSVVDGGAANDPEQLVQKRLAETYVRLERFDEASRQLDEIAKVSPNDLQVLLLRSNVAEAKKDRRAARQFLDQAVQQFPDNPLPFMRRALYNVDDVNLAGDVVQDLDKAIQLQPANITAWQMRFELNKKRGELDSAFAQLRKGVDANPSDDGLRLMLLRELLRERRMDEAAQEAMAAVQARPDDERWGRQAAILMMQVNRPCDAKDLYRVVHDRLKTSPTAGPRTAGWLLDAALQCPRKPEPREVSELLAKFNEGAKANNSEDLMLQCRALWFLQRHQESIQKARESYKICGEDAGCLQRWFSQIMIITGGFKEAEKVIKEMAQNETIPDYLFVMLMAGEMGDLKTTDKRVGEMIVKSDEFLAKPGQHPVTVFQANALKSRAHYRLKDIDKSIEAGKEALKIDPRNLEMNNNVAYMLASDKNDPKGALPFAERAVQIAPNLSSVLDTLGWIYYQLADYKKAEDMLDRAVRTARPDRDDEALIAHVHFGRARLKVGDKAGARESLEKAEAIAKRSPEVGLQYAKDMDTLRKEIESAG